MINVLILEDQPAWETLLASAIRNGHLPPCQIHCARSYGAAVELIGQTPIQLALLDYALARAGPEGAKTGLDVAEVLRAQAPTATILLVTMVDPERVWSRCNALGVILVEKGRGDLEHEVLRELRNGLRRQGFDVPND